MKLKKRTILISAIVIFCLSMAIALVSGKFISPPASRISGIIPRPGKPAAPVTIAYSLPKNISLGQTVSVRLEISSNTDCKDLILSVTGDDSLLLDEPGFTASFGASPPGILFSASVNVTPQDEGIHYLNVFVTGTFGGHTMMRSGAVPVAAGTNLKKNLKKTGTRSIDAQARPIMIMKAEETGNSGDTIHN